MVYIIKRWRKHYLSLGNSRGHSRKSFSVVASQWGFFWLTLVRMKSLQVLCNDEDYWTHKCSDNLLNRILWKTGANYCLPERRKKKKTNINHQYILQLRESQKKWVISSDPLLVQNTFFIRFNMQRKFLNHWFDSMLIPWVQVYEAFLKLRQFLPCTQNIIVEHKHVALCTNHSLIVLTKNLILCSNIRTNESKWNEICLRFRLIQ